MKIVSGHDAHWQRREEQRERRRVRRRDRVLKTVAVLPSLATLGNLVCGLGAIYMCLLSAQAGGGLLHRSGTPRIDLFPSYLAIAAYLIVGAMFFDGIDGRLARLARKTSEFGGQLDSLADIVSFGVAPAVLVLAVAQPVTATQLAGLQFLDRLYWRAEWVMAAIYTCCAAMRLARFNVENVEDESAHMGFRGLPSPGAAGAIIGLVILHQDMLSPLAPPWAARTVAAFMPPFALVVGLLMVSRFRYPHLVNTLLRGRRSFRQVVFLFGALLVGFVVQPQFTIALCTTLYALSGLADAAWRRFGGTRLIDEPAVVPAVGEWVDEPDTFGECEDETADGPRDSDPGPHMRRDGSAG